MLDFVEEASDEISVAVKVGAERRDVPAVRHRLDVSPRAAFIEALAQRVAVIGAVSQKNLSVGWPRPK